MSTNLTDSIISDSFKHLLQVRNDDKTIFDGLGNKLDDFRLSGSFTTSQYLEIENGTSQTGNKLHSRDGQLYWGNTLLADGSTVTGLQNISEDATPQLGSDLDLNSFNITGNGSGSFTEMNIGGHQNTFDSFFRLAPTTVNKDLVLIKSGNQEALKVNQEGVVKFGSFDSAPTVEAGAMYYNSTDNEFYLGK
jgi:hypothetical protein